MLSTKELCDKVLSTLDKLGWPQKVLALSMGEDRPNLNKKLHGKLRFWYDEVVQISEILGLPHLACGLHREKPTMPMDQTARLLAEAVSELPDDLKADFYVLAAVFFGTHLEYIRKSTKIETFQAAAPPRATSGHQSGRMDHPPRSQRVVGRDRKGSPAPSRREEPIRKKR